MCSPCRPVKGASSGGHRLIIERDSGLVVGSIGLFWPPVEGALELGYGVVVSRRGRGYATEATRALAGFALTAPAVHTVTAGVELSNPASARVLEKAGFERYTTTAEDAEGVARFAVTRRPSASVSARTAVKILSQVPSADQLCAVRTPSSMDRNAQVDPAMAPQCAVGTGFR